MSDISSDIKWSVQMRVQNLECQNASNRFNRELFQTNKTKTKT